MELQGEEGALKEKRSNESNLLIIRFSQNGKVNQYFDRQVIDRILLYGYLQKSPKFHQSNIFYLQCAFSHAKIHTKDYTVAFCLAVSHGETCKACSTALCFLLPCIRQPVGLTSHLTVILHLKNGANSNTTQPTKPLLKEAMLEGV